jgi:hypothetical protein
LRLSLLKKAQRIEQELDEHPQLSCSSESYSSSGMESYSSSASTQTVSTHTTSQHEKCIVTQQDAHVTSRTIQQPHACIQHTANNQQPAHNHATARTLWPFEPLVKLQIRFGPHICRAVMSLMHSFSHAPSECAVLNVQSICSCGCAASQSTMSAQVIHGAAGMVRDAPMSRTAGIVQSPIGASAASGATYLDNVVAHRREQRQLSHGAATN